jgi:hypothetical protein
LIKFIGDGFAISTSDEGWDLSQNTHTDHTTVCSCFIPKTPVAEAGGDLPPGGWEANESLEPDRSASVRDWVKNDRIGFEINMPDYIVIREMVCEATSN